MSSDNPKPRGEPKWGDVQDLFLRALDLQPALRADFLEGATDDVALRQEVERMLTSEGEPALAIERLLVEAAPLAVDGKDSAERNIDPLVTLAGTSIGPYRLLELLGRGGMGEVYLAERDDGQFRRKVAIKLMGFAGVKRSSDLLDRFDQERRVLAQLHHPGIAQLLDAGSLGDGRPYLVMEYANGQPITEYCDRARLDIDARLELLRSVCEVVQFAHSRLVIHRDLKPNNILVVEDADGNPAVKLLDFGIAKLLEPASFDLGRVETRTSARPMTPLFAAPEQFAGEALTTATDVYSLGVLLYLLLTGSPPFEQTGSALDYERMVRTGTPRRLADVLSSNETTIEETETAVRARDTTRERLHRQLSGDLERIASLALHREVERRYASAGQLGEDIARCLHGEAVLAQDDTWTYRLRVFVRRNRMAVLVAALVAMSLVVLSGFLAVQTSRAQVALALAEEESQRSGRVVELLVDLFSAVDPRTRSVGDEIPVSEFLDRVSTSVDRFAGDVALQTELLEVLGQIHLGREEGLVALPLLQRAAAAHRGAERGPDLQAYALEQLRLDHEVAKVTATVDGEDGSALLRRSVDLHRDLYGEDHPLFARSLVDLTKVLEPGEALPLLDQALSILRSAVGEDHVETARALDQRANLRKWAGLNEGARLDSETALPILEAKLGPDHPETLRALQHYSKTLSRRQALVVLRDLLERQERVFGSDSAPAAATWNTVGEHLARMGEVTEAADAFRRAVTIRRRLFGHDSPLVHNPGRNLAMLAGLLGRYDQAVELFEEIEAALPVDERSRAYVGIQSAFMRGRLAQTAEDLGTELSSIEGNVATLDRIRVGDQDPYPSRARAMWVKLLLVANENEKALSEAENAFTDASAIMAPGNPIVIEAAFLRARARYKVEGVSAADELREQLSRFEGVALRERIEVELAQLQLAGGI